MHYVVPYTLSLQASVLVRAAGDPNTAVSLDHVGGRTLRGAFLGLHPSLPLDAAGERAWFGGGVCVLNAYPVLAPSRRVRRRGLPVPRSWRREKGGGEAADLAAGTAALGQAAPNHGLRERYPERVGEGFTLAQPPDGVVPLGIPSMHARTRTSRNRRNQRPTAAEKTSPHGDSITGALFRDQGLDPTVELRGFVLARDAGTVEHLRGTHPLALGRRRRTHPATVTFDACFSIEGVETHAFSPRGGIAADHAYEEQTWLCWLLSDTVLVDDWGQPEASPRALSRALGKAFAEVKAAKVADTEVTDSAPSESTSAPEVALVRDLSFIAPASFEAFTAPYGTRLGSAPALARGSVVGLRLPALSETERVALCARSLGLHTEDGYGRFALLPNVAERATPFLTSHPTWARAEDVLPDPHEATSWNTQAKAYARLLAERLARAHYAPALRRRARYWGERLAGPTEPADAASDVRRLAASRMGRLRSALAQTKRRLQASQRGDKLTATSLTSLRADVKQALETLVPNLNSAAALCANASALWSDLEIGGQQAQSHAQLPRVVEDAEHSNASPLADELLAFVLLLDLLEEAAHLALHNADTR